MSSKLGKKTSILDIFIFSDMLNVIDGLMVVM